MKKIGMLVFCLTSSWTVATWADAAPPADAGNCTISAQNANSSGICRQCTDADGGLAKCQSDRTVDGMGYVCTRNDNGVTVEVWCPPAAGSRAKPSGCSVKTTGGPSPLGALAALGGLGLAAVLGRRWRRG
jgi:MYXO-CTERM domain-containing protein